MTKQFISTFLLVAASILLYSCKEKHPKVLGNIVLNKEVDFKSPEFFKNLSELFYIEDYDVKGNISEAVLADPKFQDKSAVFHDRKISRNCFEKFSRAYFFSAFDPIDEYNYYDTTFKIVTEKKYLGGIFHPYQIDNILTGVEFELCTFTQTYSNCPCPDIITSKHFSTQVKNRFEEQMIEKYGKPDRIDFNQRTLNKQLDKIDVPMLIEDTSYWDLVKREGGLQSFIYEWKKNGYLVRLLFKRNGPFFADHIIDPNFKKYQSTIKRDGWQSGTFLMSALKKNAASATFRVDLNNNTLISYDSFTGFIKYELDEDTQNEIRNKISTDRQEREQKQRKERGVY